MRRTTSLSSLFLRRSFPPRCQNSPPEKMNDNTLTRSSPGGNSVILFGSVPAQIVKVGSFPILSYDSSGNVVLPIRSGVSSGFGDTCFDVVLEEMEDESCSELEFGMKRKYHTRAQKRPSVAKKLDLCRRVRCYEPFDICLDGRNSALQAAFNARMMEAEDLADPEQVVECTLRPGMVLLKNYVSLSEQVEIVKTCRTLGLGPGGFYQPVFQHGAKLCLQMMCLGLNWDAETRKYEDIRPIDGTRPPGIPNEFSLLVERAIQEAHSYLKDKSGCSSVEEVLPSMTPNICIANFYTTSGRLGLHQDRDESKESLREGLPVVSISIGDSADFLYGDQRDVEKAESVVLESGDVLIFGGRSRHIFHGVTSIIPNSAPYKLLEETRLRPGRLNLTFRQY